ncbi:MAG: hypothetical protein V1850_01305, partial [Candidatus Bathyarchaeota archaeon]
IEEIPDYLYGPESRSYTVAVDILLNKVKSTKKICDKFEVNANIVFNIRSDIRRVMDEMSDAGILPRSISGGQGDSRSFEETEGALVVRDKPHTSIEDRDEEKAPKPPQTSSGTKPPEKSPEHNERQKQTGEEPWNPRGKVSYPFKLAGGGVLYLPVR